MGCDLVGRIINVGSKVEDVKIGDRVCAVGLGIGGNAKYAILPESRVFCCPEDIHPTKVACLARNYMAAYQCLHRAGGRKIKPGDKVLVIGGSGALGQALIQLAIAAGADEVFATGKGSSARRIIENLGAQHLGRKPGEWLPYVKGEMDVVVDSACQDEYFSSHRALKRGGKLVCVGATAVAKKSTNWNSGLEPDKRFDIVKLASDLKNTSFYDVYSSLEMKRDVYRKDLFRLFHLCRNHEITPKVAFCIPLEEVSNAQLELEAGGIDGNIVCLPFGPEGKKLNQRESRDDLITEYEGGIELRESLIGGQTTSLYGKVMKDGTFKVLSKNKEGYNDFDDDMYSRAGDLQRTPSLKRVDSTPFGFQSDMEKSYRGGFTDDDGESRYSTYSGRSKHHRNRSRSRTRVHSDDDDRSTHSRSRRSSSRRNMFEDDDDARSVGSMSRGPASIMRTGSRRNLQAGQEDMSIKRSASILRNGSSRPSRTLSRGDSQRYDQNLARSASRDAGLRKSASRDYSTRNHESSSRQRGSSRTRSSSRDVHSSSNNRSRSRGASSRSVQRGRTRSRSMDSNRSRDRSPSGESVYSQRSMRSTQTADSEFTKDSVYSRDERDDVSVAQSVATNNSEFTTDTARSNRSRRMKREEVAEEKPKKRKGLFARIRSRSKSKTRTASVSAKPKSVLKSDSSKNLKSRVPSRNRQEKSKIRSKSTRESRNPPERESSKRHSSSSGRRESERSTRRSTRSKKHKDTDSYYEEEEVRSVVLLKGASEEISDGEDSMLREIPIRRPPPPTPPAHARRKGRSSSKSRPELSRSPSKSALRSSSRGASPRSSSRGTSPRSSSRGASPRSSHPSSSHNANTSSRSSSRNRSSSNRKYR